jgi:hypothetical protein
MSEKDAWVKAYLEDVRRRNKLRMNTCSVCGKEAKWIKADKHKILPVCREHVEE